MNDNTIINKLVKDIEGTRIKLHNLIFEKQYDLLDSEIIQLSQQLDQLLSQYHNIK